ncbi:MAG TPA: trypsin-like peptidase domain-containing protein [Armatimonadota bacterium]|nr:trypsin-like peptidase domain-containing protein [Armatimonadota bacterium]HQK95597.1 trypsin-like peptidase domain-containing protein [Armatimonadota bacterium]
MAHSARDWWTRGLLVALIAVVGLASFRMGHSQGTASDDAERLGQAFAEAARTAGPAVVNISATRVVRGRAGLGLFDEFFPDLFRQPDMESTSLGSGVIIDPSGYVVTNNHVVAGAQEVRVSLADGRELAAEVRGADPATDLAVLKIGAQGLPAARWADSDRLQLGEWVVAIGNPYGLGQTITAGIVSAKHRVDVGVSAYADFIQTDAAINPGNSGGALVNVRGELVGINTAILSQSGGYQGIGFAIPSNLATEITGELIRTGKVDHGFLGVIVRPLTEWLAQRIGQAGKAGELVVYRMYDGPAYRAGIRPGDIIESVDGTAVESERRLGKLISDRKPGDSVRLIVRRKGKRYTFEVPLAAHPSDDSGRPIPGI